MVHWWITSSLLSWATRQERYNFEPDTMVLFEKGIRKPELWTPRWYSEMLNKKNHLHSSKVGKPDQPTDSGRQMQSKTPRTPSNQRRLFEAWITFNPKLQGKATIEYLRCHPTTLRPTLRATHPTGRVENTNETIVLEPQERETLYLNPKP